jgi:H+/gluconate symporter-like permease
MDPTELALHGGDKPRRSRIRPRIAIAASGVILLNLLVSGVHGWAHQQLGVELAPWEQSFVVVAVVAGPLLALVLYWTPFRRAAAAFLFLSMTAALAFGVHHHFIVPSPDHVSHLPPGDTQSLFVVTAVLLAVAEAIGVLFPIWTWPRSRQGST